MSENWTPDKIDPLGDGLSFVRLSGWFGSELEVVNAARVSFHNESEWAFTEDFTPILEARDQGLIKFLLKHRHGSPFEQGFMSQWHVRMPFFVMREWARHRIGVSINEESGRYVELRPDYYIPSNVRTQVGKPGSYTFEKVDQETALWMAAEVEEHSALAYRRYREALDRGIAKEQARMFLPLNFYTEVRWTANARSLMHFLSLRNDVEAQFEIRQFAAALEIYFKAHMSVIHEAFVSNGRIAP